MASHVIGNMGDDTLDDPLSDRYKRIGCLISPVDKDSDDYKMVQNYLEKTYESVKVADIVRLYTQDIVYSSSTLILSLAMLTKPYILILVRNMGYQLKTSSLWKLMKAPLLTKLKSYQTKYCCGVVSKPFILIPVYRGLSLWQVYRPFFLPVLSGTRSSNLLRHLHKGFLPACCSLPVPGYMV